MAEPPNCIDDNGRTPLHLSAYQGEMESALHLLAAGALMDRDVYGRAPLHESVLAGQANMTNLLLDAGAYIELRDNNRRTPLHHAASQGHAELLNLLLTRSAEIDALDGDMSTSLHHTSKTDAFINSTKVLTDRGASLEPQDVIGFTPLHYACRRNQMATVESLLDNGVDIYTMDEAGFNPLIHAAAEGHEELVDWLINQVLRPKTYPTPDPSKFITQDLAKPIFGLPAWLFAILVTCTCGSSIVIPAVTMMRRFTMVRKPYICDTDDDTIEIFVNSVWGQVATAKDSQEQLCQDWDKLPAHTLKDLHRVK